MNSKELTKPPHGGGSALNGGLGIFMLEDLTMDDLDNIDRSIFCLFAYEKHGNPLHIFVGSDKWKLSNHYKLHLHMANYFARQIILNFTQCA